MIIHQQADKNTGGNSGLTGTMFIKPDKKYKSPFQKSNYYFHLYENQHFSFNVGFFLFKNSEIKIDV